jgi:hypothetical protein
MDKRTTIAIITRLSFSELLTKRQLEVFTNYVSSIMNQTNKDFKVYLLMNEVRAFKGCQENRDTLGVLFENNPIIFVEDPERFKYDVEVRLDYDDIIAPSFIQDIVDQCEGHKNDELIISYQPTYLDYQTGEEKLRSDKYSEECPSMCMALVQKNEKKFGVYDRPHNLMSQETQFPVVVQPEGFYYLVVHGENELSTMQVVR